MVLIGKFNKNILKAGLLIISALFFSCQNQAKNNVKSEAKPIVTRIEVPAFNADSAFKFVKAQVDFGPRVPNTGAHAACANYLSEKLNTFGAKVVIQEAELEAWDGTILHAKNIIGQINPEKANRILLCAHWDSRPYADQEIDASLHKKPIDGANDGASGVGVLLEIARLIGHSEFDKGVDIIFFDAEDYGQPEFAKRPQQQDSWCLGSQYWAANPHTANYYAEYGILLDMVGAKNPVFPREHFSDYYAKHIVDKVWNKAHELGYSHVFSYEKSTPVIDDHLYVNQLLNIPCINIIHRDQTTASHFGNFWHTHDDTIENIDKNTLGIVGNVVLHSILE